MDTGGIGNRILRSFLSGSYVRGTAVNPLGDNGHHLLIDGSSGQRVFQRGPEPSVVLRSFADAVRYRYENLSLYATSLHQVELSHIDIDCVPGYRDTGMTTSGSATGRTMPGSVLASAAPHGADEANQLCDGWPMPAIKLLKAWNRSLPATAQIALFRHRNDRSYSTNCSTPEDPTGLRLGLRLRRAVPQRLPTDQGIPGSASPSAESLE